MIEMAITCLALNLYHEARGEPEIGQWAVAQVTMNRAENDPAKVCDTVFKPRQFSWTNRLVEAPTPEIRRARAENYMPREAEAWELAKKIARRTLQGRGRNVVGGATHYHADYVAPRWASTFSQVAQIGSHVFYR
ncbi:hypothetical protein TMEC54S_00387 [Thauera mechernichensis]